MIKLIKLFAFLYFIARSSAINNKTTTITTSTSSYQDDFYYCTSHLSRSNQQSNAINWILRNKKCFYSVDKELSFMKSFRYCADIPYASSRLMHKNEFQVIKNHINFYDLFYASKNSSTDFSIWLVDNEYADHFCSNKSYAPIVRFNNFTCRDGCFDCASRKDTNAFFVCVKFCGWKVPVNSFCNTMNLNEFKLNANLYLEKDHQIYVCQGDLKCIDYNCQCEHPKKLINKIKCV